MAYDLGRSRQDGPHALLARMAGRWQGVARTWFEPDKLADESPIQGEARLILDGMFLLHEYEGSLQGAPMRGAAIHGYDLAGARWTTAWVDSFHNGTRIMLSQGESGAPARAPDVLGHYPAPPGPDWGWRTTLELRGAAWVITHYNLTPEGAEAKAVEIEYARAGGAGDGGTKATDPRFADREVVDGAAPADASARHDDRLYERAD